MDLTQLNPSSTKIQHDLGHANQRVQNAIGRLSSGSAHVNAADNITQVSVSASLSARVTALHAAAVNAGQATSLLQVADGGLNNIMDILSRMQQLSATAEGAGYSNTERMLLDKEFQILIDEVDRIAETTRFNGIQVLVRPEEVVFQDQDIDGTIAPDLLNGGGGNDTITGFDDDDIIVAGAGNDQILPGALDQPGLQGRIWRSGPFGGIANLAEAEAIIANEPIAANFTSSLLDYPNGAQNNQNSNIGNFLGVDAATLDAPLPGNVNRQVYEFTGFLDVPADGNYQFNVGSDDGFLLQIDGATVSQFPNNRGFNFTNANTFLTAGQHPIRIVFWENGGQEGLEVFSDVGGGGLQILDDSVLSFTGSGGTDGNDTIDGEDGTDIVAFRGNQADYTVTVIAPGQATVTDNRPGSPDGTDNVVNVEVLRFADTDLVIGDFVPPTPPPAVLEWQVTEDTSDEKLEYEIIDARAQTLFTDPDSLDLLTREDADRSMDAVKDAIGIVLEYRSYIGGQVGRAGATSDELVTRIAYQDQTRAAISETDIPIASTEYAAAQVLQQSGISLLAQSNRLHGENVQTITDEVLQFGERPLDGGPLVNMRTEFDL